VTEPAPVPVNITEQLPAMSVHVVELNVPVPVPELVNVTVPVGVLGVPAADVSATVAVHVVDWPVVMVAGVQLTVVLEVRTVTVTVAVPLLPG